MTQQTKTTLRRPADLQEDANGYAIVYDVYERKPGAKWSKDHGEYLTEEAAQKACDRLAEQWPDSEYKPRRRRGMKATAYKDVVFS